MTLQSLTLNLPATLSQALEIIDINAQGVCFVVDDRNRIVGVLTDGDIRRSLLKGMSLSSDVRDVMNTEFLKLLVTEKAEFINGMLNDKIRHIPLVDENNILVDYASRSKIRKIPVMQPSLGGNELAYVTNAVRTGWISSQGGYVKQFEQMFSEYCDMPFALATSNGTTALHLALVSLGIGPGDEVIVPDFTFAASINSILYTGATPVIVDIDRDEWTISVEAFENAITPRTKAVMPVHIYGNPCRMDSVLSIARKHGIFVVEDCAEALGSSYNGRKVGSFGDVSAFSFFGNKTITTGEGGMLLFRNKKVYELAGVLRDHGMDKSKRYWHEHVGFNYRMTNLQAAIGVAQMERIENIINLKINIAQKYDSLLDSFVPLQRQKETMSSVSTYWLYTLLVLPESEFNRDELALRMYKNGIETRPAFYSLHTMPVYAPYWRHDDCSNSLFVSNHGLSLPSFIDISDQEINDIVSAIDAAYMVKAHKR